MIVWLVPIVGALVVLHLLVESDPDLVRQRWIPNDTINTYVLQVSAWRHERSTGWSSKRFEIWRWMLSPAMQPILTKVPPVGLWTPDTGTDAD